MSDRRGKKGRIGKKGAADAEEFNGKLGYKEKKKLAKEVNPQTLSEGKEHLSVDLEPSANL